MRRAGRSRLRQAVQSYHPAPTGNRSGSRAISVLFAASFLVARLAFGALAATLPSGLVGGGFVNVITADSSQNIAAGADVAGVYRLPTGQVGWAGCNRGVTLPEQMSVASIAYDSTSTMYSAYGVKQLNKGGIAKSTDCGLTWAPISSSLKFSGQGLTRVGPSTQRPRTSGQRAV